jgi:hypothetical protein
MDGLRQLSVCKKYEYLYYGCKGHEPISCGRASKCPSRRVRADRLDQVVWQALCDLLRHPDTIPQLHQSWAIAKQQSLTSLSAQQEQLLHRQQRLERQDQRLVDAYQTEIINLEEFKTRRQKLAGELEQIKGQRERLTRTEQETHHWRDIIEHAENFSRLLGQNLDLLSFEESQAVVQCLIRKVVVTGEQVDIFYALPFALAPQACQIKDTTPEGAPGGFYRLRLAHLDSPTQAVDGLEDFGWPDTTGDVSDEDVPAQQVEALRTGVEAAVAVGAGLATALVGHGLGHWVGDQADGHLLAAQQHLPIQALARAQQLGQVQGLACGGVVEAHAMAVTAQEEGVGQLNGFQDLEHEVGLFNYCAWRAMTRWRLFFSLLLRWPLASGSVPEVELPAPSRGSPCPIRASEARPTRSWSRFPLLASLRSRSSRRFG